MSKITLTYKKADYTLEYSRQSVKQMENLGFSLDEFYSKPANMIPLLFEGAFIKNHTGIKRKLMDEIFEAIPNRRELLNALVGMYSETLNTLLDDNDVDEGNAAWAMVE